MGLQRLGASPIGENGGQQTVTEESRWEIHNFQSLETPGVGHANKTIPFWGAEGEEDCKNV